VHCCQHVKSNSTQHKQASQQAAEQSQHVPVRCAVRALAAIGCAPNLHTVLPALRASWHDMFYLSAVLGSDAGDLATDN
jgi:hypothetical protein